VFDSGAQREVTDVSLSRPLRDGLSLAERSDEHVSARVVLLNQNASPSTVSEFVVAVVIDSINGASIWLFAHVA
jgi:hypothetical protein